MKDLFKKGDKKRIVFTVAQEDVAQFHGEVVHNVCSTFALGREIEWATRQYVLEMEEDDEEGVGTSLHIDHKSAAAVGAECEIHSEIVQIEEYVINCRFTVLCGSRVIATGTTGQKVLKKEAISSIFSSLD